MRRERTRNKSPATNRKKSCASDRKFSAKCRASSVSRWCAFFRTDCKNFEKRTDLLGAPWPRLLFVAPRGVAITKHLAFSRACVNREGAIHNARGGVLPYATADFGRAWGCIKRKRHTRVWRSYFSCRI